MQDRIRMRMSKEEEAKQDEQHMEECAQHAWNLHKAINRYYHIESRKSPGDFGRRKKVKGGTRLTEEEAMILNVIVREIWSQVKEVDRDFWHINCLLYAVAQAATKHRILAGNHVYPQATSGNKRHSICRGTKTLISLIYTFCNAH